MKRAGCGRLSVSENQRRREGPAARMKSKAPNERPFSACWNRSSGLTPRSLPRVGHLGDLVEDGVHRLAALRFHLAEVDVLDRVVGGLVKGEVAARALERNILERLDELVLVGRV